jgi:glycosyltransferase involved in cell wall biosynthesis
MQPTLLYVSPVVPSFTGNGLAMRAGAVLEALTGSFRVSVLTAPVYTSVAKQMPDSLRQLCHAVVEIPAESQFFDVVHIYRLASLAAAKPYLNEGRTGTRHLDLDDIESKTLRRIAALQRENHAESLADQNEAAARKAELLEVIALRQFQRVYVCSEADRQELLRRRQAEVCVLPNVVHLPAFAPPRVPDGTWRLLFAGTLGYYPNEDAVVYFCTRVLPLIRQSASCPVEVTVVGPGVTAHLRDVARNAGVHLAGFVPDLAPAYQASDTVIVPIRAGGGTRIKILEAFAYGCPVVASTLGAEGIDARAEEHLLIADTPQSFADCCLRLMQDRVLRERLVANALGLLRRAYSPEALQRIVACLPEIRVRREFPTGGAPPASR